MRRRPRGPSSGTSLPDLLVALALSLVVAAGLARLAADVGPVFASQPEASDLVQRARASLGWLAEDLALAGNAAYRLGAGAPLVRWLPPIHPRRLGGADPDTETVASRDRVTVLTVPDRAAQAMLGDMASPGGPLPLDPGSPCPPAEPACAFAGGGLVLVFDATGAFESVGVAGTAPGLLVPRAPLTRAYARREDARVAALRLVTYYLDVPRRQLRREQDGRASVPIADDVVALDIRYFGDPLPPVEPRPPPGDENCVIDRAGMPRLAVLGPDRGTLVELAGAMLGDGPWCGAAPFRYDADLFRVRQVRVTLRLQAESPAVRGLDPARFVNPGVARGDAAHVPDVELRVDVSPRNLRIR